MKSIFTRSHLIVGLTVLSALALCSAHMKIYAGDPDFEILRINMCCMGISHGETARFSVVNLQKPIVGAERVQTVFVQVKLYDARGVEIARSAEIAIPPSEFRVLDFDRDALPLAGESSTGRLQARGEIQYRFISIVDRTQITPDKFPASLELFDNRTGKTAAFWPTIGFFEVTPQGKPQ